MKKIIRLLSFVAMITTLILVGPQQTNANSFFSDINEKDEFYKEVNYIANFGIIKGYEVNGQQHYKPANNITRFQASKMLIIATGNENHDASDVNLKNLTPGTETYHYVSKAVSLGYFTQKPDGTILPGENVTRSELARALAIAFNYNTPVTYAKPLYFNDVAKNDKNAEHINALYYAGVSHGSNGTFSPDSLLTRGQFALFVARAMDQQFRLTVPNQEQIVIGKGIAKVNDLNVRTSPSTAGKIVGKLNTNDKFEIVKVHENWLEIKYFNQPAFISSAKSYVELLDADSKPIGSPTSLVKVKTGNDTLNVRTLPSVSGTIIGTLNNNEVVEVYKETNGWLLILNNGLPGYISASYTEEVNISTPGGNTDSKLIGKVTAASLNVRSGAGDAHTKIGELKRGQKVEVKALNGYWATIDFNGKTGFVHKSYLKLLNQSSSPLQDRIIVIDAGHGGSDPGAAGNGIIEKTLTLDVAKRVEAKLKNAGAKVLMTRTGDTFPTLKDRTDFAKKHYAETFVSIHGNSFNKPSANGVEVFYDSSGNPNGDESRVLAQYIQNNIVKMTNLTDRGVKNTGFYVLKNNQVASVLVELGFMTNKEDADKLKKNPDLFAEAIYQGLLQYYSVN